MVRFAHLADSITVPAPKYFGGQAEVVYSNSLSADSLSAIIDSLHAVELSSVSVQGRTASIWEISGVTLEDAAASFQGPESN